MNKKLSLQHSLDLVAMVITVVAFVGVLQTFIIGKHFIIPTMLLFFCVLFGNFARFGLQGRAWAKQILFWIFFLFTSHVFFALFWAKKYREVLGDSFVWLFASIFIVFAFLLFKYAQKNGIFRSTQDDRP